MELLNQIKHELEKKGITKEISVETNFKDLELDSLDAMDLIVKIEEILKITIDDNLFVKIKTVGDLINAIQSTKRK